MLDYGLRDRAVIVTGGASGIGLATARLLADQGAKVGVLDLQTAAVEHCVADLRARGATVFGLVADVRDEAQLATAAAAAEHALGPIYGLAACAGIGAASWADEVEPAEFNRVMDVNALGLFLSCRAFARRMLEHGEGAIVAVSSLYGEVGHTGRLGYVASKFAVNGIVKTLAIEWARGGVRVNAVAPTLVATPMLNAGIPKDFVDLTVDRTPMARIATPEDVASASLMLLSDAARYVNGVILPVDGGLSAGYLVSENGQAIHSKRVG